MNEKTKSSQRVYQGSFLDLYEDEVELQNGKTAKRVVIKHPGAAAILAIDQQGHVILTKQFRYPIKEITLEIPAGKRDLNETYLDCAKREFEEETGYKVGQISHLFFFHPCLGYSDEGIELFIAKDCYLASNPLSMDPDEHIEVTLVEPDQISSLLHSGQITDGKTIIALLHYLSELRATQ